MTVRPMSWLMGKALGQTFKFNEEKAQKKKLKETARNKSNESNLTWGVLQHIIQHEAIETPKHVSSPGRKEDKAFIANRVSDGDKRKVRHFKVMNTAAKQRQQKSE